MKKYFYILITALFVLLIFNSCVTYDSKEEGVPGKVYKVRGTSVLMDSAADYLLAVAFRNDGQEEVKITIRPVGGDIGYNYYSGSGTLNWGNTSQFIRAGYLVYGNDAYLKPEQETMMEIFLKNWYMANKTFESRMIITVTDSAGTSALEIKVDQDDLFVNAKRTFQENLLNMNNPTMYGSKHRYAGELPRDYELKIPPEEETTDK